MFYVILRKDVVIPDVYCYKSMASLKCCEINISTLTNITRLYNSDKIAEGPQQRAGWTDMWSAVFLHACFWFSIAAVVLLHDSLYELILLQPFPRSA